MTAQLPISSSTQLARFGAHEFWLLADSGAFTEFAKSELIEGEVWVVNAVHSRHARVHASLTADLVLAVRQGKIPLIVYSRPSTALSDDSIAEPDIALARRADGKAIPGKDVLLAIEISDSTLSFDLGRKAALYARHGIPEYWVVDVEGKIIHQHWEPRAVGYAEVRQIAFGDEVVAKTVAGLTVATNGLG